MVAPVDRGWRLRVGAACACFVVVGAAVASLRAQSGPALPPATGRVFWLRADFGVTRNLGDLVSEWRDASNPSFALSNVWATAYPEWRAAAVGGQPALHFDGNDFLYGHGMPTGSYTKVVVCQVDDLAASDSVFAGFRHHSLHFAAGDRARLLHADGARGGDFVTSSRGIVAHVPVVLVATYDDATGNGTIWQDGVEVGHGNDARLGNSDATVLLGSYALNAYFSGSIAEVMAYDHVVQGRDLDELQGYLLRRYSAGAPRVHVAQLPKPGQVLQRDANDEAEAVVQGEVASDGYDAVVLEIARDGALADTRRHVLSYANGRASFRFAPKLPVGCYDHVLSLWLERGSERTLVAQTCNVCVGDVWLVNGQSNAAAGDYAAEHHANADCQTPWVRSFGTASTWGDVAYDLHWDIADGETNRWHASIGQWAIRMGQEIVNRWDVPVGIVNGALGGTTIAEHQRDPNDPWCLATIYGRMLYRVANAGVQDTARALIWYQGESDKNDGAAWLSGWQKLRAAWALDFPGLQHIYVFQVRDDCSGGGMPVREVQRELIDQYTDTTVMSTTAAPQHDGCHFRYLGYRELGERMARLLGRDFYGAKDRNGIEAPNILDAHWVNSFHRRILLEFRDPKDALVFDSGAEKNFFTDDGVAITRSFVLGNKVWLALAGPSSSATISYAGHAFDGPWLKNARGIGALAFFGVPIQ